MNDFLYKLLPMILALTISQIIYLKIDEKYNMNSRISLRLHIKQEWLAAVSFLSTFAVMFFIGVLSIYVINLPTTAYFILGGILTGVTVGMKVGK
ncbi:hypothetical protein [Clostridium sp. C8-1-8]|uniref:hypothetical protein n=1 Tax=Clostridium sp. C8-1-8 TaxID=2698831 RepID=UPI00136A9922|nr:hypothetical protein [Clostridium sp. C8-1-8]